MHQFLNAALPYVPRWVDYQMQHLMQPGCVVALAHRGEVVLEQAFGVANLATGDILTRATASEQPRIPRPSPPRGS
nr:hypothetical protein [Bradyrhizobium sp. 41S5]